MGILNKFKKNAVDTADMTYKVREEVTSEMAEENKDDKVLELDQAGLDALIDERAAAKAEELFLARDESVQKDRDELARLRNRDHQRTVADSLTRYEGKLSPATLKVAGELMLADTGTGSMLELSIEGQDDPSQMTATDIVLSLLETIPETVLSKDQPRVPRVLDKHEDGGDGEDEDTDEVANDILTNLRKNAVRVGA